MIPVRNRVLAPEDVKKVHEATLRVLEEQGIRITDAGARDLLISGGARPGDNDMITHGSKLLENALNTLPNQVSLFDRNGSLAAKTSGKTPYFSTGLFCRDILDHTTQVIRPFLFSDIRTVTQVCDQLSNIHLVGSLGFPTDLPSDQAALSAIKEVMTWTQKPVFFYGNDEIQSGEIWAMIAQETGGWSALRDRPCALDLIGPTSPLALDSQACRRLMFNASRGLPTVCFSAVIPGASGPITLAGSLVQASAESLAGIVLHQLANPGAPVLSGSNVLPMDMRTGSLAYASGEYNLVCQAAVDYFEELGIPTWIGAGHSDAHCVDIQAASDIGMNMNMAAFSSSTLIHNLGYLSSGKTASLEMLVLGDELAAVTKRLKQGIGINEEALAVDIIRKETPTNGFLKSAHTLKHCRSEFLTPSLFQRESYVSWHGKGNISMNQKIRERLKEII